MSTNIMIVGVGGQGAILASRIIGTVAPEPAKSTNLSYIPNSSVKQLQL